jgi:hypothetical protein
MHCNARKRRESLLDEACLEFSITVSVSEMRRVSYKAVKAQEAKSRMSAKHSARRSPSRALALQKRASLVGHGKKWRITNFNQVAHAMAKWA